MSSLRKLALALLVGTSKQDGLPDLVDQNGKVDYGAQFFTDGLKQQPVFGAVGRALRKFVPSDASFLDMGCGHGMLVSGMRDTGLTNVHCIEGSKAATEMWPKGERCFCAAAPCFLAATLSLKPPHTLRPTCARPASDVA